MSEKNKVKLNICGNDFFIVSEDSEEYIRKIGDMVDVHIQDLMKYTPNMSTSMAAVFTALEYCDEATKSKESADNLRTQIKDYLEDSENMKNEVNRLHRKEQDLERELHEIKQKYGIKDTKQE